MTRTVTRHVPGKLFAAGEYAVVEPGNPAILVAVDRRISVTVTAADSADGADADVLVTSDLLPHEVRLRWRGDRLTGLGPEDDRTAQEALAHVVSALEVTDRLRAERGLPASALHLTIGSRLHDRGRKYGLGSSGAVTVATVEATAAYRGMELPPAARFRLALLATALIDPGPSGGDLAASTWGGWISYRAPDRGAVLESARRRGVEETLRVPWPEHEVRRLPSPRGLALVVGWTGRPASTTALVAGLDARDWRGGPSHRDFLARSADCVRAATRAIEDGDRAALLDGFRTARQLLARLDEETGLGIFTPQLRALCDTAEAVGGAAKPSGAGGGDCGIALLPEETPEQIARLRARWEEAGIVPLPIRPADRRDQSNDR
ncbi:MULTISPECIES: phosphomevalonate kinase [unclassified Streptomyces]|uniref:phosphomevalonate kinase n=1 Tax=unclassified Streptomyces TaxID=2593676 RepID=UPI00379E9EC5